MIQLRKKKTRPRVNLINLFSLVTLKISLSVCLFQVSLLFASKFAAFIGSYKHGTVFLTGLMLKYATRLKLAKRNTLAYFDTASVKMTKQYCYNVMRDKIS